MIINLMMIDIIMRID